MVEFILIELYNLVQSKSTHCLFRLKLLLLFLEKKGYHMVKTEWTAILKNKFLLIVIGVMLLIPALYNIIFLGSMWDPYGKVDKLPVAFVNNDQTTEFQDKKISLGKNLEEKLNETKALDFHFVSTNEAAKGIDSGKYYMVVTVPENFSKNATTLLTDQPQQMTLNYQTTQGRNLTASKMTATAISELKSQVSAQVTEMYTETLLSQFGNLGTGMQAAADGSNQLALGTDQLTTATATISTNLDKLAASSLSFADGSQTLSLSLKQYTDGANQLNQGASRLTTGMTTLATGFPALATGMNQLNSGAATLSNGITQYTTGAAAISSATTQLHNGVIQLTSGLPSLTSGVTALSAGSTNLTTSLQTYTAGVADANTGAQQIADGLNQLNKETETLPTQIHALHEGTEKLAATISATTMTEEDKDQLIHYVSGVHSYIVQVSNLFAAVDLPSQTGQTISTELTALTANIETLSRQIETAKQSIKFAYQQDLAANAAAVADALSQSGVSLTEEQKALIATTMASEPSQTVTAANELTIDTTSLTNAVQALKTSVDNAATTSASTPTLSADDIATIKNGADTLASTSPTATAGLIQTINDSYDFTASLSPTLNTINQGMTQLDEKIPDLVSSIQQLALGSAEVASGTYQLNQNSSNLVNGSTKLTTGLTTLNQKTPILTDGAAKLTDGSTKLEEGTNQLATKSRSLISGAAQLTNGMSEASEKLPALNNGIDTLLNGSQQLSTGTSQLQNNGEKLVEGAEKLTTGAQQISSGSGQLAAGENTVNTSLFQVKEGLSELNTQLGSGAQQISQINTKKDAANAVATPVTTKHNDSDQVANNGTAMAPYMMSVALFVGTLTVNMMFDAFTPKKKPTAGTAWWASKMSVLGAISVLQAILVYVVLTVFLGMEVLHPASVISFLILEAVTFMSIVTLFNLVLGKAGSFLMLIFMMLQLAGSAGTYPIQLTNGFYEMISPFLPMTYSIRALRQGISIGGSMFSETVIFLLLLVISNGCMILYFNKKKKKGQFELASIGSI